MTAEALSRRPLLERAQKTERLDLRLSATEKHLLEDAASATARTVTDFVLQSASVAAQDVLADRTNFALNSDQWAAFAEALDRQPRYLPNLAAFLAAPSVLDRE